MSFSSAAAQRTATAFAVAVAALLVSAAPAAAHATFVGPTSYPSGTDQHLTLDVPHERGDGPFNVKVEVQLPTGWTAPGCDATAPWQCSVDTGGAKVVVRWTKPASAGPTAADERFSFTAQTGAPGSATFPVVQTYDTGEAVHWIGGPGAEEPAPVLTIVAAPTTSTTAATTTPGTTPSGSGSTTSTGGGGTIPSGSSTSTTATSTSTSTSTTATSTSTSTAGGAVTASPLDGVDRDGGSGGGAPWIVGGVLAVAVVTAGLVVMARRGRLPWPRSKDPE